MPRVVESRKELQTNSINSSPNFVKQKLQNPNDQNTKILLVLIQMHVQDYLWTFSFIGHAKDIEVYFLQQGWDTLVEMSENERDK